MVIGRQRGSARWAEMLVGTLHELAAEGANRREDQLPKSLRHFGDGFSNHMKPQSRVTDRRNVSFTTDYTDNTDEECFLYFFIRVIRG